MGLSMWNCSLRLIDCMQPSQNELSQNKPNWNEPSWDEFNPADRIWLMGLE